MLKQLLLLYAGGLTVFLLVSACLWAARRTRLLARLTLFWLATVTAMAMDAAGIAAGLDPVDQLLVEASGGYLSIFALARLLRPVFGHAAFHRADPLLGAGGILGWYTARMMGAPFAVTALALLPVVIAPAVRAAIAATRQWRAASAPERTVAPVLWIFIAHQLDYPFLRPDPEFAPLGFTIGVFLLLALAAVLFVVVAEREALATRAKLDSARSATDEYRARMQSFDHKLAVLRRQLQQKQRFELVGSVAGGVAHDFNNLLGLWTGHLELLSRELVAPTPGQREAIEGMRRAAVHAGHLVERVIGLLRGHEDEERNPVRVATAVREAVELARTAAPPHVVVRVEQEANAIVLAARGQIQQAVLNLLTNAIQALEQADAEAEPRIVVGTSLCSGGAAGRRVDITVADNGPGVPPDIVATLAEPFVSGRRGHGGLGLGLSIVRETVAQLGGQMRYEPDADRGARFVLSLPVVETAVEQPGKEAPSDASSTRAKVVVVDDEQDIVELVATALRSAGGCEPVCFSDPMLALEWVASYPEQVKLMITDAHMPRMSGGDLLAACRAVRPDLPAILMTGDQRAARSAREDAQFDAVVRKPFTLSSLLQAVLQLTGLPGGQDECITKAARSVTPGEQPYAR